MRRRFSGFGRRRLRVLATAAVIALALLSPSAARADYALYQMPGQDFAFILPGSVTVLPGGMATLRHHRGNLHFKLQDIQIIKTPSPQSIYSRRAAAAQRSKDVDEMLDAARWALRNGLLTQAKSMLSEAWKVDPKHPKLAKLAGMMMYINKPVPQKPEIEQQAREFVGGREMTASYSKHFLLLHSPDQVIDPVTKKSRAEMRLELLETVYETFFLFFAFEGHYLKPPEEHLQVVLFGRHADFLHFATRLDEGMKQAAGFYLPKEHVSVFFDAGTSAPFQALAKESEQLAQLRDELKRKRRPGGADIIRFANTIELLNDIVRENEDISTVSHEAVHHLAAACGLFPRDGAFVRWIHEGLASFFESPSHAAWAGVGAVDKERIGYYRILEGEPVAGSLEFIVSDLGFALSGDLSGQLAAYGQAWALTHFLMNNRLDETMKFYRAASQLDDEDRLQLGKQLLEAFDEAFGDRAALELEWRRYMRTLRTDIEQLVDEGKL